MKLSAIYNVWDGVELLKGSIDCLKNDVDLIVIVYQTVSNYGEEMDPTEEIYQALEGIPTDKIRLELYKPECLDRIAGGSEHERMKRNIGLGIAKSNNCTHFLHLDCDEYYVDFKQLKEDYLLSDHQGSVCRILTYFKKPTLRLLNYDNYFVPFIHKLNPGTSVGINNKHPFYVDPTRRVNCNDVILLGHRGEAMHHFSYVRKDIERKIRNSSARKNIFNNNVLEEYNSTLVAAGYFVKLYQQHLIEVPNIFNIKICE